MLRIQKYFLMVWQFFITWIFMILYTIVMSFGGIVILLFRAYKFFGLYVQFWAWSLVKLMAQPYTVEGAENIPKDGSCIVVSNHISSFDIPLLGMMLSRPTTWVMKNTLLKVPILGCLFMLGLGIPIERQKATESTKASLKRMRKIRDSMDSHIIIYPEGMRSRNGKVLPFKRGFVYLMRSYKMDILPVTICGGYSFLRKGALFTNPDAKVKIVFHPVQRYEELKDIQDRKIVKQIQATVAGSFFP